MLRMLLSISSTPFVESNHSTAAVAVKGRVLIVFWHIGDVWKNNISFTHGSYFVSGPLQFGQSYILHFA